MRKILKQVTVTGADDSIDYYSLYSISKKYPFVEWGILLSKNSEGYNRFPTWKWIERLITEKHPTVNLSGHLCGSWVRDIINGGNIFLDTHRELTYGFNRFQLNFHGELLNALYPERYIKSLQYLTYIKHQQIIFQADGVNQKLYNLARSIYGQQNGINAVMLYDLSGGNGVLPDKWQEPIGGYCGYAGGLSPENLKENLDKLCDIVGDTPIWVDAETHLRSNNDKQFDLDKVVKFLEIAKPYVL